MAHGLRGESVLESGLGEAAYVSTVNDGGDVGLAGPRQKAQTTEPDLATAFHTA